MTNEILQLTSGVKSKVQEENSEGNQSSFIQPTEPTAAKTKCSCFWGRSKLLQIRQQNNRYQSLPLPLCSGAQIKKGTTPAGRLCHNFPPREYFDLPLEQLVLSSVKADTERAGRWSDRGWQSQCWHVINCRAVIWRPVAWERQPGYGGHSQACWAHF